MKIICPKCTREIAGEDINPAANIAYCRLCSEGFALTNLVKADAVPRMRAPEKSRSQLNVQDNLLTLILPRGGLKGLGCFLLIFSLFWNGVLLVMCGAGLMTFLRNGTLNITSSSGKVSDIFGLLFMVPFFLVGIGMACATLFVLFGQTSLVMDRERGIFRREIFGLKFDKKFGISEIKAVKLVVSYTSNDMPIYGVGILRGSANENPQDQMPLSGRICFGSNLSDDEKNWLVGEIHAFWKGATWSVNA